MATNLENQVLCRASRRQTRFSSSWQVDLTIFGNPDRKNGLYEHEEFKNEEFDILKFNFHLLIGQFQVAS